MSMGRAPSTRPGNDDHVMPDLGLYVLGALSETEDHRVEIHLVGCAECRAECDELGEVAVLVALLSRHDVCGLDAALAMPEKALVPAAGRHRPSGGGAPNSRPSVPVRATVALRWRPGSTARTATAAAVVILATAGGVGFGVWLQSSRGSGFDAEPIAAAGTDSATGAMASVEVRVGEQGRQELRVIVVGLRAGAPFQIIVATRDGQTHVVHRGTAVGGPHTLIADLPEQADDVTLCIVAQLDGAVAITVPLPARAPP